MVNKILSMYILEEMSLVYRISKSNVIHEVLNLSSEITQTEVELEFLDNSMNQTCIYYTPRRIMIRYHHYEIKHA